MNLILILGLLLLAFSAFMCGFTAAQIMSEKTIDRLQEESLDKATVRFALHAAMLPHKMKEASSWNAALMDVKHRLEL